MPGAPSWTPEELEFIKTHYPTRDTDWLAEKIGRSASAIQQKAGQLGVGKKSTDPRSGEVYGYLTMLSDTRKAEGEGPAHRKEVQAQCKCGVIRWFDARSVKRGHTKSCGCYNLEVAAAGIRKRSRKLDIDIGFRCGRWTVVGKMFWVDYGPGLTSMAVCQCDCGEYREMLLTNIRRKRSLSCGCYQAEMTSKAHKTHGMSKSSLYKVWCNMKSRCFVDTDKSYPRYGGRGITVCDEWLEFEPFLEWAMVTGYNGELEVDRIDNDKGYSPENCRWADDGVQGNNKSTNVRITAWGESKTVAEWSRDSRCTVTYAGLLQRVHSGWESERAISAPSRFKTVIGTPETTTPG